MTKILRPASLPGAPLAPRRTVSLLGSALLALALGGCNDWPLFGGGGGRSGGETAMLAAPAVEGGLQRLKTEFEQLRPSKKPLRPDDPGVALFAEVFSRVVQDHVRAVEPTALIEGAIKGLRKATEPAELHAGDKPAGEKPAGEKQGAEKPPAEKPAGDKPNKDKLNDRQLMEAAITGMMSTLDPYSSYLNPESYRNMQAQTHGEFGGLGIEVTMDQKTGFVRVVAPIDGTPAAEAGLRSGDLISAVDGSPIKGLTLVQAVFRMRGPTGTSVRLTLHRAENEPPRVVTLIRSIVKLHPVQARTEGEVGYIRLTTFNERTATEMEDAIARFKQTLGSRFAGLVLDLRNDPGGLLDQAIAVSDDFIDSGQIVAVRGRRSVEGRSYDAGGDNLIPGLPVVVLINGGSASASEIVTAALQDHRRALVFGTRSYGKGSVQTVSPLPDGGALRLTTARYYRPAGTSVDCVGVNPDLEIKSPQPPGRAEEPHQDPATCAGTVQLAPQPPSLRMADICPGIEDAPAAPEAAAKESKDGKDANAKDDKDDREAKLGPDLPLRCAVSAITTKRIVAHH